MKLCLVAALALACSSAPPKPPCDEATLAALTAACAAQAAACAKTGGTEEACTKDCDAKLDARSEQCR